MAGRKKRTDGLAKGNAGLLEVRRRDLRWLDHKPAHTQPLPGPRRSSDRTHQTELARAIRERDEALEQQVAIRDILRVISKYIRRRLEGTAAPLGSGHD
jgi:hypothetical protein